MRISLSDEALLPSKAFIGRQVFIGQSPFSFTEFFCISSGINRYFVDLLLRENYFGDIFVSVYKLKRSLNNKIMDSKTNKSVLLSVLALAVMACSALLLGYTINVLSLSIEIGLTFILILTAIFLYVIGASLMGRIIIHRGEYWKTGAFHNGITFALLVIGTGSLLLCLNGGLLPMAWKCFFISWPMLLFVLGCAALCRIHYISGIILTAIGIFLLVPLFPDTPFDKQFLSVWWPVFIVLGGLLLFVSILIKPKKHLGSSHCHSKGDWENNYLTTENQDGTINHKFVFSGTEQVFLDPVFKGGSIETVFGGMELDLRKTSIAEGETYLYVKAVFGGVEIKAPEDWHIEVRSESAFGGATDDRHKSEDIDHTRKLIIFAKAVFGGVVVK